MHSFQNYFHQNQLAIPISYGFLEILYLLSSCFQTGLFQTFLGTPLVEPLYFQNQELNFLLFLPRILLSSCWTPCFCGLLDTHLTTIFWDTFPLPIGDSISSCLGFHCFHCQKQGLLGLISCAVTSATTELSSIKLGSFRSGMEQTGFWGWGEELGTKVGLTKVSPNSLANSVLSVYSCSLQVGISSPTPSQLLRQRKHGHPGR